MPSSILRMSLIPLAVNYLEKNGAPQESGSTKEKLAYWTVSLIRFRKKLLMAEKRRKIETISELVGFLKLKMVGSSSIQVLFLMFSKRLIYLRLACCLLALSRKVERISKRPISDSTCFHQLWYFFSKATRLNYYKWVHHLVQNLWSLGELLLFIIKSFCDRFNNTVQTTCVVLGTVCIRKQNTVLWRRRKLWNDCEIIFSFLL